MTYVRTFCKLNTRLSRPPTHALRLEPFKKLVRAEKWCAEGYTGVPPALVSRLSSRVTSLEAGCLLPAVSLPLPGLPNPKVGAEEVAG